MEFDILLAMMRYENKKVDISAIRQRWNLEDGDDGSNVINEYGESVKKQIDNAIYVNEKNAHKTYPDYEFDIRDDHSVVVQAKDKDRLVKMSKVIMFTTQSIGEQRYLFKLRKEYQSFDDLQYIATSYLYRRLFGYSMSHMIKCIIVFLSTFNNIRKIKDYSQRLPEEVKATMKKFFAEDDNIIIRNKI